MGHIAPQDGRDSTGLGRWRLLRQPQHTTETAKFLTGLGLGIGVAGDGEVEFLEAVGRPELTVLRTLERGAAGLLGERVGVERGTAVLVGVVDRRPPGRELETIAIEGLFNRRDARPASSANQQLPEG